MERTISPMIDDNYQPKAETASTIEEFHCVAKHITRLLMAAQFIYPLVTVLVTIVVVTYYLYHQDGKEKKLVCELRAVKPETTAKLMVTFTLSVTISLFILFMSTVAVAEAEYRLDEHVQVWYNKTASSAAQRTLYWMPIVMLIEDAVVSVLFIGFVTTISLMACLPFRPRTKCESGNSCQLHCQCDPRSDSPEHGFNLWVILCAYSIVFPLASVAIHANHIAIAFIQNKVRAISMALTYGIIIYGNRQAIAFCTKGLLSCTDYFKDTNLVTLGHKVTTATVDLKCEDCKRNKTRVRSLFLFHFIMIAVSIVINGLFGFVAATFVIIPINDAIDKAPAGLQSIYSTSLLAVLVGVSYFFFFKKNGPLEVKITKEQLTTLIPPVRVGQDATLSQADVTTNHIPQNGDLTQEQQDKVIQLITSKRLLEHIPKDPAA